MKKRILLIEDEKSYIDLISLELEMEAYCVISAPSLKEARTKLKQSKPDLIILDLRLPDGDGLEFCKELRSNKATKHFPIIMLTSKDRTTDKIVGLKFGADDYVTKPFEPGELLARIEALLRRMGRMEEPAKILKAGVLTLDIEKRAVTLNKKPIRLNPKEFDLLRLLMEKKGKPLNRTFLTESVWGFEYFGTSRTIDFHVAQLRKKLKSHSNRIITLKSIGYMFDDKK
jgi:DNA-binding response OmpR family regulator